MCGCVVVDASVEAARADAVDFARHRVAAPWKVKCGQFCNAQRSGLCFDLRDCAVPLKVLWLAEKKS